MCSNIQLNEGVVRIRDRVLIKITLREFNKYALDSGRSTVRCCTRQFPAELNSWQKNWIDKQIVSESRTKYCQMIWRWQYNSRSYISFPFIMPSYERRSKFDSESSTTLVVARLFLSVLSETRTKLVSIWIPGSAH